MDSKLRVLRTKAGWPIALLAVRSGCGPGTILSAEKYGHVPRIETQAKIAKALGVHPSAIWPAGKHEGKP